MAPTGAAINIFPRNSTEPDVLLSYDYRGSLRGWDIVCQTVCLTVSTILVLLRSITKFYILRSPGWEDYSCIAAWAGLIGYIIVTFEADKVGSGIHQNEVAPTDLIRYAQLANISQIIYGPLIFITKLSILLLYVRAFLVARNTKTFFVVHVILWSNLAFYTAHTFVEIFECTPRDRIWDHHVEGTCVNVNLLILITAAFNVLSDFSLLLLPIIAVWRLQLRKSQKWGMTAIFAAGLFGCISSVMRLSVSVNTANTTDKTYDWFPEFLWTSAEISSGIIASCLPAMPNLIRYFRREGVLSSLTGAHRSRSVTDLTSKSKHRKDTSGGIGSSRPTNMQSSMFQSRSSDSVHGVHELFDTSPYNQQQIKGPQTFLELEDANEWERTLATRGGGAGPKTVRTECKGGSESSIDLIIDRETSNDGSTGTGDPGSHKRSLSGNKPVQPLADDALPRNGIMKTVELDFQTSRADDYS